MSVVVFTNCHGDIDSTDLVKTFAVAVNRLDPNDNRDGLARDLLARAAFFAPGVPIPTTLLAATLPEQPDTLHLEGALQRLATLGLVDRGDNEDPIIPLLVAVFVREKHAMAWPRQHPLLVVPAL